MWKLDLKDVYFFIPLSEDAKGYVRFYWEGNFYQFLFLYWIETGDYYLFARHANDGKVSKGETELLGYSDSLVIEVGLCHN